MDFLTQQAIYKNYDIRGRYPEELTDTEARIIGAVLVQHLGVSNVAVGRDNRPSADALFTALTDGLRCEGANVIDLGMVTTPMTYFVCGSSNVDMSIMITASHLPAQYNGFKICIEDAKPLSAEMLQKLRTLVAHYSPSTSVARGTLTTQKPYEAWHAFFKDQFYFSDRNFSLVVDPANMVGVLEIDTLNTFRELSVTAIYDTLDATTPHHEANPLKYETLHDLGERVKQEGAQLGIAFDGDADRVGFVDERGVPVPADIIGVLLARALLNRYPGSAVVYDLRSTKAIKEIVEEAGGIPIEWKVGHPNIRYKMREHNAVLGIELAGHFFFRDTFYSEGGPLPVFLILELIQQTGQPLSVLAARANRYAHSGEINSEITRDAEEIFAELQTAFPFAAVRTIDGLKLTTPSWWLSARTSATEPLLRLNVEADTTETMEEIRDTALAIVRS